MNARTSWLSTRGARLDDGAPFPSTAIHGGCRRPSPREYPETNLSRAYSTTTAVPLTLTMNMPLAWPRVS
jgi:hypothetical protein